MADLQEIRKRLERFIEQSGLSYREISLKIGRKDSYIHQYIKYGFPKRLNELDRKKICRMLNVDEKELIDDELIKTVRNLPAAFEGDDLRDISDDYVNIDILAPRPDSHNRLIGRMSLNFMEFGSWLAGNPFNLRLFRVDGDYMNPTLPGGSLVVFDTACTDYAGDGLYVLDLEGAIVIRRLQRTGPDTYVAITDNPRYHDCNMKRGDMHIMGRATFCLIGHPL